MKILIVDDDPEMLLLTAHVLSADSKMQVLEAGGAEAALLIARAEKPDAVLTDYRMAGMNGMELMQRLRAEPELQHIPIVFCSGKSDPVLLQSFKTAGAAGTIIKPYNPELLANQLLQILHTPTP